MFKWIARNRLEEFKDWGCNLVNLAVSLGMEYQHHGALGNSITCGKIVIEAIKKSSITLD